MSEPQFPVQPEQHQMVLKETFPDGSQEFECPICGRRFILHCPPNYRKVVLEVGNEYAIHSGGTGGVRIGRVEIHPVAQSDRIPESHEDADIPQSYTRSSADDLAPYAGFADFLADQ